MEFDEKLLLSMPEGGDPVLHFYDWVKPAATYGLFLDPSLFLRSQEGLDLAKRPTGGGLLFHIWDLAFSVVIPKGHPGYHKEVMSNYKFINDAVLAACKDFLREVAPINLLPEDPLPLDEHAKHFCFAKPTKYDVMIQGKKIAGAAQRKKKNAYLHQGSISIVMPKFDILEKILPKETKILDAMKIHTFAPLKQASLAELEKAKEEMRIHLKRHITSL